MSYRHGTYSLLHDEDLLLAMQAVRNKLHNPDPPETSLFSFSPNRDTVMSLTTALAMMQQELDYRVAENTRITTTPAREVGG